MAIELRQFHQTFFDESVEGLASMEATLLRLEQRPEQTDAETLNAMFRVVHSIKGGSGTFGFGWITDFSHTLEGLLDDLREGRRRLDKVLVALLLRSVDSLRHLLDAARGNSMVDKTAIEEVTGALENLRRSDNGVDADIPADVDHASGGWRITFRPKPELFRTGNDPLRILRELATLGDLTAHCDTSALPGWRELDVERCYLGWVLELRGEASRTAIDDIFAWVTGDAAIEISPLPVEPAPASVDGQRTADGHTLVKLHGTSLRIGTQKVDALVDIVGELVITQTMLQQTATRFTPDDLPRLLAGLALLERNVRELQESVMSIRLLPLGFLFSRLPRLVRDIGEQLGKRVELRIVGEQTELDKTVIERISDPILHMVRNAIDHGIESPAERRAAGKSEIGSIRIEAQQKGGNVIVEVEDDGRGMSYEKILSRAVEHGLVPPNTRLSPEQMNEIIFLPGMSTSEVVTDLSGRGVGLDVVRNNVRGLGGNVEVRTRAGKGTLFVIRLPLTLAILDGLGVQVGEQKYILPLASITESVRLGTEDIERLPDGAEVFLMRQQYLRLVRLHDVFGVASRTRDVTNGTVVIIEADGVRAGLFVDDILGQQQVVIKSLETHYARINGVAAATILGDGTVALILDAGGLIRLAHVGAGVSLFTTTTPAPDAGAALH